MPQPKDKDWLNGYKNKTPCICCLQETHLKTGDTYRLKVKGWKKIFHAKREQKKAGVAILISDKIDFKTKAVKRDKDGHSIQRRRVSGCGEDKCLALVRMRVRS